MITLRLTRAQFDAVYDILAGAVEDLEELAEMEAERGETSAQTKIDLLKPVVDAGTEYLCSLAG